MKPTLTDMTVYSGHGQLTVIRPATSFSRALLVRTGQGWIVLWTSPHFLPYLELFQLTERSSKNETISGQDMKRLAVKPVNKVEAVQLPHKHVPHSHTLDVALLFRTEPWLTC